MHEPYVSSYVCEECGPTFNADGSPQSAVQHHDRHHAPSAPGDASPAEGRDTSDLPLAAWRALSFLLKYGQSHMVRWMVPDWNAKMCERDARNALFWVRDAISNALGFYQSHETLDGEEQRVWRYKCCGERVDISKPPQLCSKCITCALHESAEKLGMDLLDMGDADTVDGGAE